VPRKQRYIVQHDGRRYLVIDTHYWLDVESFEYDSELNRGKAYHLATSLMNDLNRGKN